MGTGIVFGNYRVEGRVGVGATSVVWKAHQPDVGRTVAIKELLPAFLGDEAALDRFRTEARLLASFDHPNIVRVYDFVEDPESTFIVEEWVNGSGLDAVIARGRLQPEQALAVLHGALSGLAHAHQSGVVHGDVKPSNVLVDEAGTSKLVDFGLASRISEAGAGLVDLRGTPGYVAPELARHQPLSPASDVYAAGVMLHELLTGRRLVAPASPARMIAEQLHAEIPSVDGIGPRLNDLLRRATSIDPGQRPPDAAAFLAELQAAAEDRYGAGWLRTGSVAGVVGATVGAAALTGSAASAGSAGASTLIAPVQQTQAAILTSTRAASMRGFVAAHKWIAATVVAGAAVAGVVVVATNARGSGTPAAEATTTVATLPPTTTTVAPTTTHPATTVATTTTLPAVVHLTSVAAATDATMTPADPGATATFDGPLPAFNVALDCVASGCDFLFSTFAPNATDQPPVIPVTDGHVTHTASATGTCTGRSGTEYTRTVTTTIDLVTSGTQQVGGLTVPTSVTGTITTVFPEAGYVPHVGDVVDQGAEIGCNGQTMRFTIAGTLVPA